MQNIIFSLSFDWWMLVFTFDGWGLELWGLHVLMRIFYFNLCIVLLGKQDGEEKS